MILAVADTHAIIWYLSSDPRLSTAARTVFESGLNTEDRIAISSISLVEMVYLIEKGRIAPQQFTELAGNLKAINSILLEVPVDLGIARALARVDVTQIPDMPDRIVAATAVHLNVPIISRDGRIQLSTLRTIW